MKGPLKHDSKMLLKKENHLGEKAFWKSKEHLKILGTTQSGPPVLMPKLVEFQGSDLLHRRVSAVSNLRKNIKL